MGWQCFLGIYKIAGLGVGCVGGDAAPHLKIMSESSWQILMGRTGMLLLTIYKCHVITKEARLER